jgi:hypothetical protein
MFKPCAYLVPVAAMNGLAVIELCAVEPGKLRIAHCLFCEHYTPKTQILKS